nr:hypothetical protein [Candidatus Eremiobacteraeota bacterium]
MNVLLEAHLGIAYLVLLLALFLGWVPMGRRVMVGVIGLQVVIGIILAATLRPPAVVLGHIVLALLAMGAYVAARRASERVGSNALPIALSAAGVIF